MAASGWKGAWGGGKGAQVRPGLGWTAKGGKDSAPAWRGTIKPLTPMVSARPALLPQGKGTAKGLARVGAQGIPRPIVAAGGRGSFGGACSGMDLEQQFNSGLDELFQSLGDLSVPNDNVMQDFQHLLALRQQVIESQVVEQPAVPGNQEKSQKQVLHLAASILEARGAPMALNELCADPTLQAARKGVVAKMEKFIEKYPDIFAVYEVPHEDPTKAAIKEVQLLQALEPPVSLPPLVAVQQRNGGPDARPKGGGGKGGGGNSNGATVNDMAPEEAKNFILNELALAVKAAGGEAVMSTICADPRIVQARKGVIAHMGKFLAKHPEVFEVYEIPPAEEGKAAIQMVRLLPGAELPKRPMMGMRGWAEQPAAKRARVGAGAPNVVASAADIEARKEELYNHVQQLLLEVEEGALRLQDLANEPLVKEIMQSIPGKLGACLEKQGFHLYDAEDEQGHAIRCVAALAPEE